MALTHTRWEVVPEYVTTPWSAEGGAAALVAVPAGDQVTGAGSPACRFAKRTFDVVVALLVLLVALPVMVVLALVIRRDGGPALFRHTRIGRHGRPIGVYKFRSMAPDAEAILAADPDLHARHNANGFKLPADEDPRITPLGRILRSSSLDELPQLLNVLSGEMSLVGPRPVVADELGEYELRGGADAYLAVRPGMTGAWQVSGRSLVGYDERVALDAAYVRRLGLATDLRILCRTVNVVARRVGAH